MEVIWFDRDVSSAGGRTDGKLKPSYIYSMRRKRGALFVDEERFFSLTGECGSPATDMKVRTCCGQGSLRHDEDNIMFRS